MPEAANITIQPNAELTVFIEPVEDNVEPYATIINSSGGLVDKITLLLGANNINITHYLHKGYAIRVVNGKNVTVQKI
jgi:hypothetical protein